MEGTVMRLPVGSKQLSSISSDILWVEFFLK